MGEGELREGMEKSKSQGDVVHTSIILSWRPERLSIAAQRKNTKSLYLPPHPSNTERCQINLLPFLSQLIKPRLLLNLW